MQQIILTCFLPAVVYMIGSSGREMIYSGTKYIKKSPAVSKPRKPELNHSFIKNEGPGLTLAQPSAGSSATIY